MKHFTLFLLASLLMLQACGGATAASSCSVEVTSETSGAEIGIKQPTFGSDKVAQSIKFSADTTLTDVQLKLKRTGSAAGTLTMIIETDSGSAPSGSAIFMVGGTANSATLDAATVSATTSEFYTFTFAAAVTMQANTTYWVTVGASYNASSTALIKWMANSANAYADGNAISRNISNSVWSTSISTDISGYDLLIKAGCP